MQTDADGTISASVSEKLNPYAHPHPLSVDILETISVSASVDIFGHLKIFTSAIIADIRKYLHLL